MKPLKVQNLTRKNPGPLAYTVRRGVSQQQRWTQLAEQGRRLSRPTARPASQAEAEQFTASYREAATDLARVRAFSPNRRLAEFIEATVAAAHFAVYRPERPTLLDAAKGAIFAFPGLVRRYWKYHLTSMAITMLAAAIAFGSVSWAPETYSLFVGAELAAGRGPDTSREELASSLGAQETKISEEVFFSQMLFTHNTRVAFMVFAFGFLLGLPTIYILIRTGLMLGAFTAVFVQAGLTVEFLAWILPHGVPEIGAIILCGGAGLALGHRILNPGKLARGDALTATASDASLTALGCVPLLFIAGLIEGIFRQSTASTSMRFALFAFMLLTLGIWLFFTRRRANRAPIPLPA